ncbi:MAG: class III extradiol ring-cleavage dioxygenase [Rhodovibrionaceae bacterium]
MTTLPALFVSHGSPMIAITETPASLFLKGLAQELPAPKAILCITAHWETVAPRLSAAARPGMIYDFYGFPEHLYRLNYAAPGDPDLAARAAELLEKADLAPELDETRGFDHGTWVPLQLIYPAAEIPVVQLSVQPGQDTAHHLALGEALRPLREDGVLILGSGNVTHNLGAFRGQPVDSPAEAWAEGFAEWLTQAVDEDRREDIRDYRALAPSAVQNHPSEEHFLPFFVALGAATPGTAGKRLHRSMEHAVLAMDAYAFA